MKYLKNKLVYSPFLALAYNGFIPISLSINLNNQHNLYTHNGEVLAHWYSNLLMFYIYLWFPLVILYVIFRKDQRDKLYQNKYGYLLKQIKSEKKFQRTYFMFFIIRRFVLIQSVILIRDYSCLQIQITMLVNLGMLILVGGANYFLNNYDRHMAIMAECFIIIATINLVSYTDFILNLEFQYQLGMSFIVIICL